MGHHVQTDIIALIEDEKFMHSSQAYVYGRN